MRSWRRTVFFRRIIQILCFCLLLQGSGIAQALPLPPKKTFVSKDELAVAPFHRADSEVNAGQDILEGFGSDAWNATEAAGSRFKGLIEQVWAAAHRAMAHEQPFQIAQTGGTLPLPAYLFPAFFAAPPPPGGPPSPPGFASTKTEATPPARAADLLEKAGTDEIPLVAGWNLISIPLEPPDPDPAVVFASIASQLARVEAHDACDAADPWKLYDPADAAASDLTAVTPAMGLWVKVTAATVLPLAGTLPATTDVALCQGWNHIGFPADQPRAPTAVFSSIAGKWQRLFGHDAFDIKDPFEFFDPAVPAWANDLELMRPGYGYWLLASEATTFTISNQGPPPTVAFTAPLDLGVGTEPTEITGTVDSDRLETWTLTAQPLDDGPPVTLATGTTPVADAPLGDFDPTLLLNGLYQLDLTATDFQGQQVSDSIAVTVEGRMKIGHFSLSFVDLAIPVSGLDIEIVRTYQSRDKELRDFGVGWSLDIRQGSYRNNRAPGDGWQIVASQPPTPFPCVGAVETKSHLTVVRLSDQEVYRFRPLVIDTIPGVGRCDGRVVFEYVDGPLPGTTLEIIGNDLVYYQNAAGNDQLIDYDTLATFEPRNVRVTTRDGRTFELDLEDGVTLVEDLNGNQLTITPAGITHSNGKSIAFARDAEGRITRITDPMNREMFYGYDSAGDLVSFADRAGNVTRFTYDDGHFLLDFEDPRGVKPIRNEYDDDGRLVRHIDAFGKAIELSHDLENRREVATNRLGASRALEYDSRGNVIRETDELGNVTTRIFDSRDNLLSETDPLGRTTTYTYTATDEVATRRDPLGNTVTYTYDGHRQLLTLTDRRGGVTSNVYDSRSNLIQTTDALGNVTLFTYDASGNLLTRTDAMGHVTTYEVDAFGNRTKEVGALGRETIWTYDAAGNRLTEIRTRTLPDGSSEVLNTSFVYDPLDRLTTTTAPDGSNTTTGYDPLGHVIRRTDQLGRVTAMSYDAWGRLTRTDHADGTFESQSYDAEGRRVSQTDRAGRVTTFAYDPVGRLVRTTFPDGAATGIVYDAAGQVITTADALGNMTSYTYDAAGRRTSTVSAVGTSVSFTHDANGNQTSTTDALGHTTSYTYDLLNRLTTTTFPDGAEYVVGHDALGRRISETDPDGIATAYGFDALGRLIRVTDALGHETTTTYDALGNLVTLTDARDRTTHFEYDRRGRQIRRVLPGGVAESRTYNADGSLASMTSFDGTRRTFGYDAGGRLIRVAYTDGSEILLTYTSTGRRQTVTDARGVTSYAYDPLDRLTEKVDPAGHRLTYAYDSYGNLATLTVEVAGKSFTTAYSYDAVHRPTAVTDSLGGVTSFSYHDNGRVAGVAYANGVSTSHLYDGRRRLTELTTSTGLDEVIQSYVYSLSAAGRRQRVDEHDGTSRHYSFDALGLLERDRVSDAQGLNVYRTDFVYDAVGNRTSESTLDSGGTTTITATYDVNDRLLTWGQASYAWDANGHLVSKTHSGSDTYQWDFADRLTVATLADGTEIRTTYDIDGNRVRTETTTPGGPVTTLDYLVDPRDVLSHVVAEVVDGQAATVYTRVSDRLISLYRPLAGEQRFFHHDGSGSVRALTDAAGQVTDQYAYTAFGRLLDRTGDDSSPYRFAGEPWDSAIGFSFNRARWLDVETGRFLSMDPQPGSLERPFTLHRYLYAEADPVNKNDPTGQFTSGAEVSVAFAIRAEISSLTSVVASLYVLLKACELPGSDCDLEGERLVYRGTDRTTENEIFDETGFILSDFAGVAYRENGGSIGQALADAFQEHQEWLADFNGDEIEYALWHQAFGKELGREFGRERTLVSVTKSKDVARQFAGTSGRIYSAEVPLWELIPTAPGPEGEFVFRLGRFGFTHDK